MKTSILLAVLLLGLLVQGKAQLLPYLANHQSNSFWTNPAIPANHRIINPGTGEFDYKHVAGITYRDQWWNFGDFRPRTSTAHYQRYFSPTDYGVDYWAGGYLFNDRIGPSSLTGAYTTVSAHRDLGHNQHLYAGLSLGIEQFSVKTSNLITADPNDGTLLQQERTEFHLDPGLGVFYTNQVYYLGFSMPKIIGVSANGSRERLNHYYFLFGTTLEGKIGPFRSIEPYLWLQIVRNAAARMDMNVKAEFRTRTPMWITLGLDNTVAVHWHYGIIFPTNEGKQDLKITVGYDNRVTLMSQLGGGLEVSLAWLMRR